MHPVLAAAEATLGEKLSAEGDLTLLDTPRRMLLISRAQRNPQPDSPWLLATVSAATKLAAENETLVTGMGRVAYEAALFTAKRLGAPAVVVLEHPIGEMEHRAWLPRRHLVIWPQHRIATDARAQRDIRMAWLSDRASAIYIRKNGTMSAAAAIFAARNLNVDTSLCVESPNPSREAGTSFSKLKLNETVLHSLESREWLTHFTREPDGAWPGETQEAYLGWLCSGCDAQQRNGFAALCRILEEKRIRASGRLIPGRTPMVCFSGRPPAEILAQRRWRRGLLRWSFTPYALALERGALIERNAQAVRYADAAEMSSASVQQRCYMQLKQSTKSDQDWTLEDEWRIAGDVDISDFNPRQAVALVTTEDEAKQIRQRFGIVAVSLYL